MSAFDGVRGLGPHIGSGAHLRTSPPASPTEADGAGQHDPDGKHARLREASKQLEGVFVQHLTRALRATVPDGGNPDAPGADLYGSLLDEHLAEVVASDTRSGIAEALYRQLTGLSVDSSQGEGDR